MDRSQIFGKKKLEKLILIHSDIDKMEGIVMANVAFFMTDNVW
jgi:hypothetical protein